MENVLNSLGLNEPSNTEMPVEESNYILKKNSSKSISHNEYAAGELFAGMNTQDWSFHDFMVKLISVFMSIAKKEGKPKTDQRVLDIIKSSLLIFSDSVAPKRDDRSSNAALLSTIYGFVSKYIENMEGDNQ